MDAPDIAQRRDRQRRDRARRWDPPITCRHPSPRHLDGQRSDPIRRVGPRPRERGRRHPQSSLVIVHERQDGRCERRWRQVDIEEQLGGPAVTSSRAFASWWFSVANGYGTRIEGRAAAASSATLPPPRDGQIRDRKRSVHALDERQRPNEERGVWLDRAARPRGAAPVLTSNWRSPRSRRSGNAEVIVRSMWSAPWLPPNTSTVARSGMRSNASRASARSRSRSATTARISWRIGLPVRSMRAPVGRRAAVPANVVATTEAQRAASRFTTPGTVFGSIRTSGRWCGGRRGRPGRSRTRRC